MVGGTSPTGCMSVLSEVEGGFSARMMWRRNGAVVQLMIAFRSSSNNFLVDALYFSAFFGGSDTTWAPPVDQTIDYDAFVVSLPGCSSSTKAPTATPTTRKGQAERPLSAHAP